MCLLDCFNAEALTAAIPAEIIKAESQAAVPRLLSKRDTPRQYVYFVIAKLWVIPSEKVGLHSATAVCRSTVVCSQPVSKQTAGSLCAQSRSEMAVGCTSTSCSVGILKARSPSSRTTPTCSTQKRTISPTSNFLGAPHGPCLFNDSWPTTGEACGGMTQAGCKKHAHVYAHHHAAVAQNLQVQVWCTKLLLVHGPG